MYELKEKSNLTIFERNLQKKKNRIRLKLCKNEHDRGNTENKIEEF